VIIDAQFDFTPGTTFGAAAQTTVRTAQRMLGATAAGQVRAAFTARGIL
jgi:hypothetical protein